MSRVEGLKMSMEMLQDIENNKAYTLEEKMYWTTRVLLADIASNLAAIADNKCKEENEKAKDCEGCKYIYRDFKDYPCIKCKNAHGNMWEAKE